MIFGQQRQPFPKILQPELLEAISAWRTLLRLGGKIIRLLADMHPCEKLGLKLRKTKAARRETKVTLKKNFPEIFQVCAF